AVSAPAGPFAVAVQCGAWVGLRPADARPGNGAAAAPSHRPLLHRLPTPNWMPVPIDHPLNVRARGVPGGSGASLLHWTLGQWRNQYAVSRKSVMDPMCSDLPSAMPARNDSAVPLMGVPSSAETCRPWVRMKRDRTRA